jgi:hypothetical protein
LRKHDICIFGWWALTADLHLHRGWLIRRIYAHPCLSVVGIGCGGDEDWWVNKT